MASEDVKPSPILQLIGIANVDAMFDAIDKDQKGWFTREAFAEHLRKTENYHKNKIDYLVNGMDTSGEGKITRDEYRCFLQAATPWDYATVQLRNQVQKYADKEGTLSKSDHETMVAYEYYQYFKEGELEKEWKALGGTSADDSRLSVDQIVDRLMTLRVENSKHLFQELDKDGNTFLSKSELSEYYEKLGFHEQFVNNVLNDFQGEKDGNLSLDEFLMFNGLLSNKDRRDARLRRAFKEFDNNGDGIISQAEFQQVISTMKFDDKQKEKFLKENTGDIKYEDFVKLEFIGGKN